MGKGLIETAERLRGAASDDDVQAALDEAEVDGEARAALTALANDLVRSRAETRAATRAREILLASVAHDLRNPLNTFAMSAGLLRDDLEGPDVDRTRALALLSRMDRASHRMQALIDDLVEASRVEAGCVELAKKKEQASAVIAAAIAKAKSLVTEKGATLDAATIADDVLIDCDRQRTADALAKLVVVALKTTGEGAAIVLGAERLDGVPTLTLRASAPRSSTSTALTTDESRGGIALLIGRGLLAAQGATLGVDTTAEGPRTLIAFT